LKDIARALKTSAATVGRRIATLEERLGARLFDRAQTGYTLTESGEAIRLKAEEIEEAVLSVEREAFGHDLRATGKVRVANAEDIGAFVIAPRLSEFRRPYPRHRAGTGFQLGRRQLDAARSRYSRAHGASDPRRFHRPASRRMELRGVCLEGLRRQTQSQAGLE
jgi:DNA-binding transcriptional LysR family regulator